MYIPYQTVRAVQFSIPHLLLLFQQLSECLKTSNNKKKFDQ